MESDVAKILQETKAGICVAYDDKAGIKTALETWMASLESGELHLPVASEIEAYNIQKLTQRVAAILDGIVV
ncbi:MAG: hypothetical protein R2795_16520 [Saprospiraceae bacterium]